LKSTKNMKNTLFILIIFCFWASKLNAQTKKTSITTKKTVVTPKKTQAKPVDKKIITVAKPLPVTLAPQPAETPKEVESQPVNDEKVVTNQSPITGPIGSGPSSYENNKKIEAKPKTTKPIKVDKKNKEDKDTKAPKKIKEVKKTEEVKDIIEAKEVEATKAPKEVKTIEKKSSTKVAKTKTPKADKIRIPASDRKRNYFGIRAGYNLSTIQDLSTLYNITGTTGIKTKKLPGYMGGIVFNLGLSKAISLQPEILYSQQGFEYESGIYFKDMIDIVNVPLLLKVAVGSPKIKIFVNAGPYIGYKLSQKTKTNISGTEETETIKFDTDDTDGEKDNLFDFGAIGGAGLQFNLGGTLLVLEGRYQYGMADPFLYKDGKDATLPKALGHQRVITGTFSLLFPLGGK
jgi:Outer membrane protein beta-barrel domain